jgi:hypothetical protein
MVVFIIYKHCSSSTYYLNYFATYAGFVFISTWVYQFLKFDIVKKTLRVEKVENIPVHGDLWGYTVLNDEELLFRVIALSGMLVLSVIGYRTVTASETMIPNIHDKKDLETIKQMEDDCLYQTLLKQKEIIFWSNMSFFWPIINFVATFFHIVVMFVVVYQALYWKLSWVMIVYLFFAIGPWYKLDIDFLQTVNLGKTKPLNFYSNMEVRTERLKKWKTLMWITIISWVIIFPSQKILEILEMSIRTKTIFYGSWAGLVYPDTTPHLTFWDYVSGYMAILLVLVLEKKFLEWLAEEGIREMSRKYQESVGERDNLKNYEILAKEIERRQNNELKRSTKSRITSIGFQGIDEEGKMDHKEKLKLEIDDAISMLSGNKAKKEETKKPHSPFLKSALKKPKKAMLDIDREDGPSGPKPFDETFKSNTEYLEATDEEFNLIFTKDDPEKNEVQNSLLFQYKIKFMRGAKTFAEECITFTLLL